MNGNDIAMILEALTNFDGLPECEWLGSATEVTSDASHRLMSIQCLRHEFCRPREHRWTTIIPDPTHRWEASYSTNASKICTTTN